MSESISVNQKKITVIDDRPRPYLISPRSIKGTGRCRNGASGSSA
ncbi:hypothetical protein Echvi_4595 [Echinicola vietnamensis DSM 17526]|uniref:Uncharacterized protein n=1 Tax=Echinicola vietnamensis (strain DSM 17526 / LMG 23754 / KMM 6221) TaxID=926556 RepID=L0G5E2_ECHVK|nr:hypothetical protein Echvi_4595 [Echinicola vietnamensis DSM 17526]